MQSLFISFFATKLTTSLITLMIIKHSCQKKAETLIAFLFAAHTFSDKQGDRHPSFDYQLKRIGEMTEKVFSLSIEK